MLGNAVCFALSCLGKQAFVSDAEAINWFEEKTGLEPYEPSFVLSVFQGQADKEISHEVMMAAVEFLVRVDQAEIRIYKLPALYKSGAVYEHVEGRLDTAWKDALALVESGLGNCKVLAAYLIAWNRNRGVRCWPKLYQVINDDGTQDWHVAVEYPGGRIEDPSKRLGM